jgi:hypothetical protein
MGELSQPHQFQHATLKDHCKEKCAKLLFPCNAGAKAWRWTGSSGSTGMIHKYIKNKPAKIQLSSTVSQFCLGLVI